MGLSAQPGDQISLIEKMMGLSKNAKGGARGDWTPGSGDDVKTARKE